MQLDVKLNVTIVFGDSTQVSRKLLRLCFLLHNDPSGSFSFVNHFYILWNYGTQHILHGVVNSPQGSSCRSKSILPHVQNQYPTPAHINMYIHTHTHRERERYIYIYIQIYRYTDIQIYRYIYIYCSYRLCVHYVCYIYIIWSTWDTHVPGHPFARGFYGSHPQLPTVLQMC